ncbi:MAG: TROVE domain-containing protein [Clostridia bacterium]|nr:TROVE domain-containing protein [Clostridia bacterium]
MLKNMTKAVKTEEVKRVTKSVTNFMGGISYELSPIETLKLVTASSIFGEPQYYRDGEFKEKTIKDGYYSAHNLFKEDDVLGSDRWKGKRTSEIMETVIDEALAYDFKATLDWAVTLRTEYLMRLNPQVIMVRASTHPKKAEFVNANPGEFDRINQLVMARADEPVVQLTYYLYKHKSDNKLPNILKRGWAKKIEGLTRYQFNKYKNAGVGFKDLICISHPKSKLVDEYMKTGKIAVTEEELTWEIMRSQGKTWKEILSTTKLGHMALLRNLRNIFEEIDDLQYCKELMAELKAGVKTGKQFPFRYSSAIKAIKGTLAHHIPTIVDTLEECVDIARENLPKLEGKTMCLSDNSGSAWGQFTSEYGSVTVAEIGNLSSVLAAQNSDEGYVGKFGDKLKVFPISKRNGSLTQANDISSNKHSDVGGGTENGIWLFFDKAIKEKEHWDNIFVYSDMQAGHGGLYGLNSRDYAKYAYGTYIDVNKLIREYRRTVNPKVNIFMVQTAGYTNVLVPETGYRQAILTGWTGKEIAYAKAVIDIWNEKENKKQS